MLINGVSWLCHASDTFKAVHSALETEVSNISVKGLGPDCISKALSAIWGKLGTALQPYTLNPRTKFPPNPTRKVNT